MIPNAAVAQGQAAFDREAWLDAYTQLAAADRLAALDPDDLDRLATAAYLIGEDAASADARTRAHTGFLERGDAIRAARSAFWLAFSMLDKPAQRAQAGGWLARARRLLDDCGRDCVEQGFLLCTHGFQRAVEGDVTAALAAFERAAEVGARFRDADVTALARHGQARGLLQTNRKVEGFALLDEVMVAVTGREVTPMIAGVVYCSVIGACYDVFDLRRALEWTTALASWCAAHPDMVPFRGQCLVRRSELMQLHGAWPEALAEAERVSDRQAAEPAAGAAWYQQAELHRLRGDFTRADEAYRRASQAGRQPYPGLALLRLAQGQVDVADAAVRRLLQETRVPRARARVLGACVEILLAQQDLPSARGAADELSQIAGEFDAPFLRAVATQAAGSVSLAAGDATMALELLRSARTEWQELDAPYEVARVRALIGLAYRQVGDEDGAQLEFDAVQEAFDRLGAVPDSTRIAALRTQAAPRGSGPLTGREVEVLRLVATGRTNRTIAAELAISDKTVARHLSNIFTKLDLSSRAAATAYAYEHKLL